MGKVATVAIIGRPSVGKSSLVNLICKAKVAITAQTPQTTRNKIRGIYTDEDENQLIFIDTPGYHRSQKTFNRALQSMAYSSIEDSDFVVYMLDVSRDIGEEEHILMRMLQKCTRSIIVVLNKSDLGDGLGHEEWVHMHVPQTEIIRISVLHDTGITELLHSLLSYASEGPLLYPVEYYTDQNMNFRIAEIIREQAIIHTRAELPYALYVDIVDLEASYEHDSLWIRAFLCVEQESQKGIVVGKAGNTIKNIRFLALQEIKKIFSFSKIYIDIRVRVSHKWRTNEGITKRLLQ